MHLKINKYLFAALLSTFASALNAGILQPDTVKINFFIETSRSWINNQNPDSALHYAQKAYNESKKHGHYKSEANSLHLISYVLNNMLLLSDSALIITSKLYDLAQKHSDTLMLIKANGLEGHIYYTTEKYQKSFESYLNALKLAEAKNLDAETALACRQIGVAYISMGTNYNDMGLKYYERALKIYQTLEDTNGIAGMYFVMGIAYNNLGNLEKGKYCQEQLIKFCEILGDEACIARAQNELTGYYSKEGNHAKALELLMDSYTRLKKHGTKEEVANTCNKIYRTLRSLGRTSEMLPYAEEQLFMAKEIHSSTHEALAYEAMAIYYEFIGKYKEALNFNKKSVEIKGIIFNSTLTNQMAEMQAKYETEKKDKELKEKQAEILIQQKDVQHKLMQRNFFIAGFGIMAMLVVVVIRGYRQKQKANKEIMLQKDIIEEKNKDITDSIKYAKRIQEAILPSKEALNRNLKDGFLLFKPKDVVSGDFYWMEKPDDTVYFAAADCTGHGVPGAMVSVVCSNALSKALLEEGIRDTGKILDRTRELVVQRFKKSGEDVNDGMDISLCSLNLATNELQWSGANNPLWIIPKESRGNLQDLLEVKADKQPIGKTDNPQPFTNHTFELQKGDTVYIFSDGFADQFGGTKGKKFKYAQLKELLLAIQNKTMDEQSQILNFKFEKWKGNLEQVDDVCIIGIRI